MQHKSLPMQQPELGQQLATLRKQQNLTQEELVEKSNVSVRTIQRIEAGEVIPRLSTVKILWRALGTEYTTPTKNDIYMKPSLNQHNHQQHLIIAVVSGVIYIAFELALTVIDLSWLVGNREFRESSQTAYIALTAGMALSYALFASGFILLAKLFENHLLTIAAILMMIAVAATGVIDVAMFNAPWEELSLPYAILAVGVGACSLIFGIALLRLQDSMGGLAKVAGILEITIGAALISVLLFFIAFTLLIPAIVIELLVLYKGYEYLSRSAPQSA